MLFGHHWMIRARSLKGLKGGLVNLKHLRNFMIIAEHGSFSRASSVIGVAQPALGRQIQQLENYCRAKLFYRHGRGVSLTPEGTIFLARIRPLLKDLASVTEGLSRDKQRLKGVVTIGMTSTVVAFLGLPLLKAIKALAPDIKLNFVSAYSGYIHEWLVDGRLDIAILHDARRSQHIAVDFLASAQLFLVSSPVKAKELGISASTPQSFEFLEGLPLVLPSTNHGLRRTMEAAATQHAMQLDIRHELDALSLLKQSAIDDMYHTVLAMPAIISEVHRGLLVGTPIVNPLLETRLMVATSLNKPLTEPIRCVLNQIHPVLNALLDEHPETYYLELS